MPTDNVESQENTKEEPVIINGDDFEQPVIEPPTLTYREKNKQGYANRVYTTEELQNFITTGNMCKKAVINICNKLASGIYPSLELKFSLERNLYSLESVIDNEQLAKIHDFSEFEQAAILAKNKLTENIWPV